MSTCQQADCKRQQQGEFVDGAMAGIRGRSTETGRFKVAARPPTYFTSFVHSFIRTTPLLRIEARGTVHP